jgi:List-Bact-rpt repeat protein
VPGTVTVTVRRTGDGEGRVTSRSGIDCPRRCRTRVERGSRIRLDAAAVGDAVFAGWGGGCDGVDRCRLTVVEPVTIIARFTAAAADESALTVTRTGEGGGTVTSADNRITCGERCIATFPDGAPIDLTATADDGSEFTGWSGAGCSGTGGCTVTLDGPDEVTATFGLEPATDVQLTTSTEGSGTIAATTGSDAAGQDCSDGCAYPRDTPVTLTATLGEGMNTLAWSGCDSTQGTTCKVTMSEDRDVSATFTFTPSEVE